MTLRQEFPVQRISTVFIISPFLPSIHKRDESDDQQRRSSDRSRTVSFGRKLTTGWFPDFAYAAICEQELAQVL